MWPWVASSPTQGVPVSLPCFRVPGSLGEEPLWVWLEARWGLKGEGGPHFVDPDTWHTRSKPFRLPTCGLRVEGFCPAGIILR